MLIVDSQVHIWGQGLPTNPAHRQITSFSKDDLFFCEFIFAKCREHGVHRRFGALLLSDEWAPLRDALHEAFGEPQNWHRPADGLTLAA